MNTGKDCRMNDRVCNIQKQVLQAAKSLIALMITALIPVFTAYPCFSPTDLFAVEVVLNKPDADYDLDVLNKANNLFIDNDSFIYRSHFNNDVAVILREIDEDEFVKGLSVRLQIPTKSGIREQITSNIRLENAMIDAIDEAFLKSLGYEGYIGKSSDQNSSSITISVKKGNIKLNISHYRDAKQSFVDFGIIVDQNVSDQAIKSEIGMIIESIGFDERVLDKIVANAVKENMDDLIEAVEIDKDEFDFGSAIKVELEWLKENMIISGISESDIKEISGISVAGLAGWNSKIVNEKGKWLPYYDTENPMLIRGADCRGFSINNLPYDQTIILDSASSVNSNNKITATWAGIKSDMRP